MQSFNLNTNEYSKEELEDILSLKKTYTKQDILLKKNDLCSNLNNDSSLDETSRKNINDFLNKISSTLIKIYNEQTSTMGLNTNFNELKNQVEEVEGNFLIKQTAKEKVAYSLQYGEGIKENLGAPPGILNPIKWSTIKKIINIDSRFRPNYFETSSADQKINLPFRIEKVVNMRVSSIELPVTFYTHSESLGNNCFVVGWNFDFITNQPQNKVLVKIPDGRFTLLNINNQQSNMQTIINNAIQNPENKILLGNHTIASDPNFNLKYNFDNISGKSIFSVDTSNTTNLEIVTKNGYNQFQILCAVDDDGSIDLNKGLPFFLGWSLGYRLNIYTSGRGSYENEKLILPPAIVSEGIAHVSGSNYIFLAIDDYQNNVNNFYTQVYSESFNNNNIITKIPIPDNITEGSSFMISEFPGVNNINRRERNYFGPVNIEKLRITLYDEYGRIINLNNSDWSFSLTFEILYS